MIEAYQIANKGLGTRTFTEEEWQDLMDFYKSRNLKPLWVKVRKKVKKKVSVGKPVDVELPEPKIDKDEKERSRT